MFLRAHRRSKDGKQHSYWSLVETLRTPDGPRQRRLCYLGELNDSAHSRWLKTIEVFNAEGESTQLKLFPSEVEPPENDPDVARVLVKKVRLERTRQLGPCYLGWELWRRLKLDEFFQGVMDTDGADVAWSRVAAILGNQPAVRAGQRVGAGTAVGIRARRWATSCTSKKARSTIRGSTDAWIGFCRRRQNWNSI